MDPLNLTSAMRAAYDFIRKNGHATAKHKGVTENSVRALKARGLIELYEVPLGYRDRKTWVAIPLGAKKPRKLELPSVILARPYSVSAALGRYKDADGKNLQRSETIATASGEKITGGFCVGSSGTEGIVIVSFVTPDDMDPANALDVRPAMLKLYAKVLREARYEVKEDLRAGVLYAQR